MKYLLLLSVVAFASCTKKYDFECVTYPRYVDRLNGIDPKTGKSINMLDYYTEQENFTGWTKSEARKWVDTKEQDTSVNGKCYAVGALVD